MLRGLGHAASKRRNGLKSESLAGVFSPLHLVGKIMSQKKDSHFEDYQARNTWVTPVVLAVFCLLATLFAHARVQFNIESDQFAWEQYQKNGINEAVKPDIPGRWRLFYIVAGSASAVIIGAGILSVGRGRYSHEELRERALQDLRTRDKPDNDLKNIGIILMLQNMEQNDLLRDIKNKK